MIIAFDVTPTATARRSGVARYAVCLGDALVAAGAALQPCCRLSRWKRRALAHRPGGAPLRWYQEGLWPWRAGAQVVHGTDVRVPAWRCARVATVHDVFHCLPEAVGWSSPEFAARARQHYAEAARRAHVVACVSAATRDLFLAHHDFPRERTVVTPHGIDARFRPHAAEELAAMRAELGLPAAYALFVGAIAIRKNLPTLLRAWAASRLRREMPLVLAGQPSDDAGAVQAIARELGLGADLRQLDFVGDALLPALYAGAALFAFPSFNEGFGLPVLEAMASGVPVATSAGGALAEVAGGHARLADPRSVEAWVAALDAAAAMPAEARAAARRHAAGYTWDAAAQATLAGYRLALAAAG